MTQKYWLAGAALAAAVGMGGWVYSSTGAWAAPPAAFVLLDGSTHSSAEWHGQVTLLNFWATSCATCVAEMPQLVATHHKYQARGFDTVAVAMQYDPPSYVVNFAQSRQLPFKVALDHTGQIAKDWGGVQLTPTSYLVNRRGQVVKRYIGPPDFAALHQLIEKLLDEG